MLTEMLAFFVYYEEKMIFRRNYNYRFISKECFDFKCLEMTTFNDIYRKYKIVKYKKN